jgi:hypothetical protein
MWPHLVHLKCQYSSSDGPGMMRWTTRRVSQLGQWDRTVADGNGVGSASDEGMNQGQLRLGSHRRLGLQHLVEPVDVSHRVHDRGLAIGPCEADFKRRKRFAVDDDWLQIRAPDSGVPQILARLKGLNRETVIIHGAAPANSKAEGTMGRQKGM